jgi:hypothetical protein
MPLNCWEEWLKMAKYIDVERYCREICRCAGLENGCDKSKCPFCGAKMDGEVIKSMKRAGDSAKKAAESLKNVIGAFENADRCVCCGEIVPEGRQVCPGCETGGDCDG